MGVPHSPQNFDSTLTLHFGHTTGEEPHSPQNFAVLRAPHLQTQPSSPFFFFAETPLPPVKFFTFRFVWFKLFVVRLNVLIVLLILSNGIFFPSQKKFLPRAPVPPCGFGV
jgi:hypothetical protein